jgi:hypothetical protein
VLLLGCCGYSYEDVVVRPAADALRTVTQPSTKVCGGLMMPNLGGVEGLLCLYAGLNHALSRVPRPSTKA